MMLLLSIVVLASVNVFITAYTSEALADQIKPGSLPGADKLNITFNQFSGYLNIDGISGSKTKFLHYWFVESINDPKTDPLAFWTNGGPGCSGLIGFLTEQGPFKPNADNSLSFNKYAWNQVSNMVFIEAPAGVGYSYSTNPKADYTTGDSQTALDNYNLIQAFLKRFPEYQSNELHITSESYGGHYIPTLAKQIVDSNAAPKEGDIKLNFKGFAVGNPYTNPYSGTPAMYDTYWGHQLISKPTYDAYLANCVNAKVSHPKDCLKSYIQIENEVGNLNPYALDYPVCTADSAAVSKKGHAQRLWLLNSLFSHFSKEDRQLLGLKSTDEYQPCEDDYASNYLNLAAVKRAIHVKSDIKWESCSNKISYSSTDSTQVSTAPIYNYLIDGNFGLNILVYSGDDDSVCATIGTQAWIWDLGYKVSSSWQSYVVDEQVAGYLTKWSGTKLGFLTIHGAGHEVPTYKPEVALDLWTGYLSGVFTNA